MISPISSIGNGPKVRMVPSLSVGLSTTRIKFARQIIVTKGPSVWTRAYGVEPVERAGHLNKTPCKVIIEPAKKAIQEAKTHRAGMVMWTDGAMLKSRKTI